MECSPGSQPRPSTGQPPRSMAPARRGLHPARLSPGSPCPAGQFAVIASSPAGGPRRAPEATDHWTCLILADSTQLRLARPLAADLRRPWKKPSPRNSLTHARVHRTLPAHPPEDRLPGPSTENHPPRPRTTLRQQEHPATPRDDVHTPFSERSGPSVFGAGSTTGTGVSCGTRVTTPA